MIHSSLAQEEQCLDRKWDCPVLQGYRSLWHRQVLRVSSVPYRDANKIQQFKSSVYLPQPWIISLPPHTHTHTHHTATANTNEFLWTAVMMCFPSSPWLAVAAEESFQGFSVADKVQRRQPQVSHSAVRSTEFPSVLLSCVPLPGNVASLGGRSKGFAYE